ncbi:MAG: lamin tail domain-containing protein [Candidatus Poribacteria bacterium]|nr:lamin tail domain-containing protein [Candidatus Poribacteria bacterium]
MSNRLTFSLASLILMFAFVAMPVMAHDNAGGDDATTPRPHSHPLTEGLDAATDAADVTAGRAGTAVTTHDTHPTVMSIVATPDAADATLRTSDGRDVILLDSTATDPTALTIAAGGGTGVFNVRVTFSGTLASDAVLASSEVTVRARKPDGTPITTGVSVGSTVTGDAGQNVFDVPIEVTADAYWDATATPAASNLPIEVFIDVARDAVATGTTSNAHGVTLNPASSDAYMSDSMTKFTIVDELDAENMRPTLTISDTTPEPTAAVTTGSFNIMYTTMDADMDTVTVAAEVTSVIPAGAMAHYSVDTSVDGTVTVMQAMPTATMMTVPGAAVTVTLTPSDSAAGMPVTFNILFAEATYTDPGETDMGDMLEAGDYLVVVRDASMVTSGYFGANGPSMADVHVWADMPNLERLFSVGGKLELTVTGATTRQVVISEVMWAVDNRLIGDDAYDDGQWIEIHNRTSGDGAKDFAISGITLNAAEGRFPTPTTTDWLMNTPSGDRWTVPGQSGNSGDAEGAGKVEFVSVWRNNYGEPGHQSNRWTASSELYKPNHKGTPGMKERPNFGGVTPTPANRGPVIFNEISNNDNPAYEWIELRNVTDGEVNLKNWEITIVTSKGANQANHNAVEFIQFPNADRKMAAGSLLLVVATDPRSDDDHPLQTGWDITKGAGDQINGVNQETSPRYIVLPFKTAKGKGTTTDLNESGMPDDGEFVLILRNRGDRTSSNNDNNVRDVAGYVPGRALATNDDATGLWPLANFPQPNWDNNKLAAGIVQKRAFADIDGTKSKDKNQNDKTAFRDDNNRWTGIGYRRNAAANNQNGGTPGYPNGALQSNETEAGAEPVIISEVMYATGSRANIPQWIELYNTSKTVGVNLDGWRVTIINHDQDVGGETFAGDLNKDYAINGKIPPGQTFLLVAYPGRDDTKLPDERIETLRGNRGELILSQYGFEITLLTKGKDNKDANRKLADRVGNLAAVAEGAGRVRRNPQSYEDPAWMLPMGTNDDGDRISIVRASIMGDPINGQLSGAWNRFDMSGQFVSTLDATSYGHGTDLSSPGHTVGGVLPVSLSKFRPERMKDTGAVVIRWVTESELNNAGFNILRSETRDGEFTKLNTKLIAGQGTTSERTTYEYADTSAKPNVVYYYQIQDVSLDGQVQTLRQSRLKGNVTAAGKLTTTWGELKALQ